MQLTDEEFSFFKNELAMRRRFGNYYPYVKLMFDKMVELSPDTKQDILERLKKATAKFTTRGSDFFPLDITINELIVNNSKLEFFNSIFLRKYDYEILKLNNTHQKTDCVIDFEKMKQEGIDFFMSLGDDVNLMDIRKKDSLSREVKAVLLGQKKKIGTSREVKLDYGVELPEEFHEIYGKMFNRIAFVHEMLHASAYCEMGTLVSMPNRYCNFGKYRTKTISNFNEIDLKDLVYLKRGADINSVMRYAVKKDEIEKKFELIDFFGLLKEEAVVENWSTEIAEDEILGDLNKNNMIYYYGYGVVSAVAGMFDVVNNGEWRTQLITGQKGLRASYDDVIKMDELFENYLHSIRHNRYKEGYEIKSRNAKSVADALLEIAGYCDEKFEALAKENKLSDKQKERYNYNRYWLGCFNSTYCTIHSNNKKKQNKKALYKIKDEIYKNFKMEKYSSREI